MKMSQWRRAVENRCVFSVRLRVLSDRSSNRSAGGRWFHVAGPLTAKLHCPVAVWAHGTSRVPVAADRRCWRPEIAVAGTQRSQRWAGTTPWTHFQTIKAVLKTTHYCVYCVGYRSKCWITVRYWLRSSHVIQQRTKFSELQSMLFQTYMTHDNTLL